MRVRGVLVGGIVGGDIVVMGWLSWYVLGQRYQWVTRRRKWSASLGTFRMKRVFHSETSVLLCLVNSHEVAVLSPLR